MALVLIWVQSLFEAQHLLEEIWYLIKARNVKLGWNILIPFSFSSGSYIILHVVFIFKHIVYKDKKV